jgi:hypothetical protein
MYPQAVETGIPAKDYWNMSFDEILVQVSSNHKRRQEELREKALFDYSQQRLAIFAFNDPKKFPKFEDAYPFLNQIKQEVEQAVSDDDKRKQEMLKDQEILMKNAMAINETRKRKNK